MKTLKGFEALEYALENKDSVLYNRKGKTLRFDKQTNRLVVEPQFTWEESIIINDKTVNMEWYTESKKKALVKIYVDKQLQEVQNCYFFDVDDNLAKLIEGFKNSSQKRFNSENITVDYEIYG